MKARQSKLFKKLWEKLPIEKRKELINAIIKHSRGEDIIFEFEGEFYKISELKI